MEAIKANTLKLDPKAFIRVRETTPQAELEIDAEHLFPPVIVNLREDAVAGDRNARRRLSPLELEYFKRNGANATIFIHGFNVPYGEFGQQLAEVDFEHGSCTKVTLRQPDKRLYVWPRLPTFEIQACDQLDISGKTDPLETSVTVYRDRSATAARYPEAGQAVDEVQWSGVLENFNGSDAHSWVLHMEDSLNRAAGFDRTDYSRFTRIINVAWSGDVFPTEYISAEFKATAAGRNLLPLIEQLLDNGIRVNVIAHSLGNRVLLTLMNLLGQKAHRQACLDNVFMWQPAVPDTALSNDSEKDTSVLRNWNFVHAHKAAKQIVVLHSNEDNVLGPHPSQAARARDEQNPDSAEAYAGRAGGLLYPVATQVGVPPAEIAKDWAFAPWGNANLYRRWARNIIGDNRAKFAAELEKELAKDLTGPLFDNLQPRWHEVLMPLSYLSRIGRETGEAFGARVRALANADIEVRMPRPAMGYGGPMRRFDDPFIEGLIKRKKLAIVNQSEYLFDHSGMKIPSRELMTKVYQNEIIKRIRDTTGFGSY